MKKKKIFLLGISIIGACLLLFSLFFYNNSLKNRVAYSIVKVAILDSGINETEKVYKKFNAIIGTEETKDTFNHGTKVYNVILNTAPKNQEVQYYDIQVLDEKGSGTAENICTGIDKAIEYDVDIISMSLGFNDDNKILNDCVNRALEKNILIAAASGDTLSDETDYPAKYENVLSIAAIDSKNDLFSFSSTGKIDFVAPGVDVETLDNSGKRVSENGSSIAAASFVGVLMSYFEDGKYMGNKLNYSINEKNGIKYKELLYNE